MRGLFSFESGILFGLPVVLLLACYLLQPFPKTLIAKQFSTRTLSSAQITNLAIASRYLDGLILKPGEHVSFNRVVGPRTAKRGYQAAPSYIGEDSPPTLGGGICLLSSGLYQVALESGLSIEQRVPHLRTIHSVPPGLDATVWYGGADLRFTNALRIPIQLKAKLNVGHLSLSLHGAKSIPLSSVSRTVQHRNAEELLVTVFQRKQMVSRDLYRLSP